MPFEDFQNYYESKHSKLIRLIPKVPKVQRYFRRYLHRLVEHPMIQWTRVLSSQLITRLRFRNRADLDFAMARCSDPYVFETLAKDEQHLFDRSKARINVVEERFSDLI